MRLCLPFFMLAALSSSLGCSSHPLPPVRLEFVQQVGGRLTEACIEDEEIFLKKHFGLIILRYQDGRLKRSERFILPHIEAHLDKREELSDQNGWRSERLSSLLRNLGQATTCLNPQAWIPLGSRGSLKSHWRENPLEISPIEWRWGEERRSRFTGLRDMAPVILHTPLKSEGHQSMPPLYLIATDTGLWTWRHGSQPRQEPLPAPVPNSLLTISKDGRVWWLSTPHSKGRKVWPFLLFNGPPKLVGNAHIRHKEKVKLLVPLGGKALRGEKDGLELTWGTIRMSTPPLKGLCSLTPKVAVVATSRDVRMIYHFSREKDAPHSKRILRNSETNKAHGKLIEAFSLALPSSTEQVICEEGWLTLLGSEYGLLRLKVSQINTD